MIRHTLANLVSVPITMLRLCAIKLFYPRNLHFAGIERFSPNVVIDVDRKSQMIFGKFVSIHSGSRITCNSGGQLCVKDNTSFNVGCIVTCKYRVDIGKGVAFGPNVMVFDHNHVMHRTPDVKNKAAYTCKEIVVGDYSWIGAGVILLPGARIGSNCVIGAGSIVNTVVPDRAVLIQKRQNTLKEI